MSLEKEIKKEATRTIQSVVDGRKDYLKKQGEDSRRERRRYERKEKLRTKFPRITEEEIDEKLQEEDAIYKSFFEHLYIGSKKHYFHFLDTYIESGGRPTDHRKGCLNEMIYIAKNQIEILPLYGKNSLNIIVMPGCKIIDGNPGDNNFYCYDDILNQKYTSCIPTYKDWEERFIKITPG